MKQFIAYILLGIAGLVSLPQALLALKFDSTSVEHTATIDEAEFLGVFKFSNDSADEVTIKKVNTSCGCTSPSLEKKVYVPGEGGTIVLKFVYGDRQGSNSITAEVVTSQGTQTLTMDVDIPAFVKVDTALLRWTKDEELSPKTFTVSLDKGGSFKLVEAKFDNPEKFLGVLTDVTQPGSDVRTYSFEVTPLSNVGFSKSTVSFVLDYPKESPRSYKAFVMVTK